VNGFMPDFELTPSKGKLGDWNFFLKPSKNRIFFEKASEKRFSSLILLFLACLFFASSLPLLCLFFVIEWLFPFYRYIFP
jgi:hypothetical protein